jgi:adenylate cyclase
MALSTRRQDYDRLFEPAQRPLSLMSLEVEGLAEEVDLVGPLRLFPVLDQYFSTIVDSVYENEGVFLAHSLEGVTAVFGAPLASGETTAADLAAASALRLIERLREMTDKWGVEGLPLHLRAKAGVSSGSAMVGAFGPTDRPLFSVIGPQLRLVRQLTQHAEPWTLVVDSSSRSLLSEHLSTRSVNAVEVRGLDYPVFAYVAELVKKS